MLPPGFLTFSLSLATVCLATNGPKAIYFLDNNPSGANLISVQVDSHGKLTDDITTTSTRGLGEYSTEGENYTHPLTDQLTSQSAVFISGEKLFTVNPGSDTVSLFEIPRDDPIHPKLVGEPPSSGGDFPVSITYSHALRTACVLNGGNVTGIQCYKVDHRGLHPCGSFIPLPLNQTSPPHGPLNTVSDIAFNPSSTALFATVKGIDSKSTIGYIAAMPVVNGEVEPIPRISRPPGLLYEWSLSFINDTTVAITDPSVGAAFIEVAYPSLNVSLLKELPLNKNRSAFCWSQYSESLSSIYFFDGYNSMIPVIDSKTGELKYTFSAPEPLNTESAVQNGLYDSIVAGTYLYTLSGVSSIHVSLLAKNNAKIIQTKDLSSISSRIGWQGIAAWPNGF